MALCAKGLATRMDLRFHFFYLHNFAEKIRSTCPKHQKFMKFVMYVFHVLLSLDTAFTRLVIIGLTQKYVSLHLHMRHSDLVPIQTSQSLVYIGIQTNKK